MNYYNDNDLKVCAWLRELIADGLIPPGDVDATSDRFLLENSAYDQLGRGTSGTKPKPVLANGSFVSFATHHSAHARACGRRLRREFLHEARGYRDRSKELASVDSEAGRLADGNGARPQGYWEHGERTDQRVTRADGSPCGVEHAAGNGRIERRPEPGGRSTSSRCVDGWNGETRWHLCRDGKYRRVPTEPAFFPLVNGVSSGRVGLLLGAGNAIVPQLAAEFIKASVEAIVDLPQDAQKRPPVQSGHAGYTTTTQETVEGPRNG